MKFKLVEVLCASKRHHACIVWTWTELREVDCITRDKEFDTPDASAAQGLSHFGSHLFTLFKLRRIYITWLPALLVITSLLAVADRRTEERIATFLSHCQKGDFEIKVDKALNNHLFDIAARTLKSIVKRELHIRFALHYRLPFARARHKRLNDTRDSYFCYGCFELFKVGRVVVRSGAQPKIFSRKITNQFAVHCEIGRFGARRHLNALCFIVVETVGTDTFNFWHDDVGRMFSDSGV